MMNRTIAVPLILALNTIVFLFWQVADTAKLQFLVDNFLVSWTAVEEGRYWTLVTSVFSHNLFLHFFINMYVLYGFGSVLEQTLGFRRFVLFYLFAGVVGSISHCLVSTYILGSPEFAALGASGAISGVILVFSLLYPKEKILLMGIVPLPAIWGVVVAVGIDLWGLYAQAGGGGFPIGHGAHLGGAFAGLLYFLALRKRVR